MGIEMTPADSISGLPLLIAPDDRALSILKGEESAYDAEGRVLADWNHAFHPAGQVTSGGNGSAAVRNARLQFVVRSTHNEYHRAFYGPELPQTPAERFKTVVLCAAGYIPLQAMQFASDGVQVANLSPTQQERLRTSGEVKMASFSVVQKFMKDYVLKQPVDHIRRKTIDQFLRTDPGESLDAAKKHRYLTHLLLSPVIDRVEDNLIQPYTYAYDSELLKPEAPARPDSFVQSVLTPSRKNTKGIAKELTSKLLLYRGGPEAVRLGSLALTS